MDCDVCRSQLLRPSGSSFLEAEETYSYCKAYSKKGDDFGALHMSSDQLFQFLKQRNEIFVKTFETSLHMKPLSSQIVDNIESSSSVSWFKPGPQSACRDLVKRIILISVRLRMYYLLKTYNQKNISAPKLTPYPNQSVSNTVSWFGFRDKST